MPTKQHLRAIVKTWEFSIVEHSGSGVSGDLESTQFTFD
jgi:hypothetical protein